MRIYLLRGQAALFMLMLVMGLAGERPGHASTDPPGGKYAVVIGNSNYGGDDVSGIQDALTMAEYLKQLKFTVLEPVQDGDLGKMQGKLRELEQRIKQASVVLFFYSGHGFQQGGENYLMPIGGSIDPLSSMALSEVQSALAFAPIDAIKLVILDACRKEKALPEDLQGFNQKQAPSLPGTLYAFAAGPNQTAPSGSPKGFSPYTTALLRHLREPGLRIFDLLGKVRTDLAPLKLLPSFLVNGVPRDFYLVPPVILHARVEKADDDLLLVLNGEVVLNASEQRERDLYLNAEKNDLTIMVSNGKTFRNGYTWEQTEGWSYEVKLTPQGNPDLPCEGNGRKAFCFKDQEKHPFKAGPHHGKVFTVAEATLFVDPEKPDADVSLLNLDDKIWNNIPEVWARDQDLLYERAVKNLPLDKILDPSAIPNLGILSGGTVVVLLRELLKTGNLLGHKIADPEQTFFVVRGNRSLRELVQTCVKDREDDRVNDFRISLAAALAREPTPFDSFDKSLGECVKDVAGTVGSDLPREAMRVWTAIEDRSRQQSTGSQESLASRRDSHE